jgi:hypothetical protein
MTPKEKAKELFDKFSDIDHLGILGKYNGTWEFSSSLWRKQAKECALIAVDELIKNQEKITKNINRYLSIANIEIQDAGNFWKEVKQEIEKL